MFERFRLVMTPSHHEQVLNQARAEYPDECCGLLAGIVRQGQGIVAAVYPLVNAQASPTEFVSDPRSMLQAIKAMRASRMDILAVYHSHPSSAPVPSARDLAWNYSEQVITMIVGLAQDQPEVRCWWLTASEYHPAEWAIMANPPA